MKILVQIARFFVAITFIFSGFVKLVDPIGSQYKFQEYFSSGVLNIEFLSPYALPFSIILILAEVMLGVMLLIGFKPKLTVWSLFFITLIFLFLTWYSAYYNKKVADCGCFGDAIKFTPKQTFYKNVVLIALIVLLMLKVNLINPFFSKNNTKWIAFSSMFVFLFITYYVLVHLPIIDFRPYKVGVNILENMKIPEGAKRDVFKDTWIYNVNGENKQFTTEEKPWEIKGATFVDRKTELLEEGYKPPIHDFVLEHNGKKVTEKLMQLDKLMLIVMYDIKKADKSALQNINKITTEALQNGYKVYGLSASLTDDYQVVANEFNFSFDQVTADETTLKTIIRANPGIVTLKNGTITGKWNANDFDKVKL